MKASFRGPIAAIAAIAAMAVNRARPAPGGRT